MSFEYVAKTNPHPYGLEISGAGAHNLYAPRVLVDLSCGIGVNNLGHRPEEVVKSIHEQVDRYLHTMVYGEFDQAPQSEFARVLSNALSPLLAGTSTDQFAKVWFTNSGTEAVDTALKLATLKVASQEGDWREEAFLAVKGGFHGRSIGALGVTYRPSAREPFSGLYPDGYCMWLEEGQMPEEVGCDPPQAFIVELIRGEDGVREVDRDWLFSMRRWCKKNDVLFIVDEVQTGFGRTGTMFCLEQYSGLEPDVVVLGKALGGGMPLGAVVARRSLFDLFEKEYPFSHLSTFGGHPVSCAAGLAMFHSLHREMPKIQSNSRLWERSLNELVQNWGKGICTAYRGRGMMWALEFVDKEAAESFRLELLDSRVFVGHVLHDERSIRVYPPLNMDEEAAKKVFGVFRVTLGRVERQREGG